VKRKHNLALRIFSWRSDHGKFNIFRQSPEFLCLPQNLHDVDSFFTVSAEADETTVSSNGLESLTQARVCTVRNVPSFEFRVLEIANATANPVRNPHRPWTIPSVFHAVI
jgi:hypothetical protein